MCWLLNLLAGEFSGDRVALFGYIYIHVNVYRHACRQDVLCYVYVFETFHK